MNMTDNLLDMSGLELLALLGLTEADVERYRGCWIRQDEEDEEEDRIVILARTGGMNRESFPNKTLTSHPCYVCDYDDEWDETHALYEFVIPKEAQHE